MPSEEPPCTQPPSRDPATFEGNPLYDLWLDTVAETPEERELLKRYPRALNDILLGSDAGEEEHRAVWAMVERSIGAVHTFGVRREASHRYAWAVPTDEAIAACVSRSPLVEIGAGRGYWAALIARAGGDIVCYDTHPPDRAANHYHHDAVEDGEPCIHGCHHRPDGEVFYPVHEGDESAAARYPSRAVFLCWPRYSDPMAERAIGHGPASVLYVGEGPVGCTATDAFHKHLESDYELARTVVIPQWWGLHDGLEVWDRKGTR